MENETTPALPAAPAQLRTVPITSKEQARIGAVAQALERAKHDAMVSDQSLTMLVHTILERCNIDPEGSAWAVSADGKAIVEQPKH